jgi:hypothetical protein
MNLKAKPIVKNQYWVITDGDKKVGNVISDGTEFAVKIENKIQHYDSTKEIEKKAHIEFIKTIKPAEIKKPAFAVFPTPNGKIYNSFYDIKRKMHIFTKTAKSKCYYAAGWFALKQAEEYEAVFCPKYIFVQRYDYKGPFKTQADAEDSINSL